MIDWTTEVMERYDLQVESSRKGRGAWIFETDRGLMLLKEYKGTAKRLEFEEAVLETVRESETLKVDQYVRNKEQELISTAEDGTRYIVKNWYDDRECDMKDIQEILSAVRQTAVLHKLLRNVRVEEEWNLKSMVAQPIYEEMERHNRELRRARTFIRGKQQKNEFELCVIDSFQEFYDQAAEARRGMEELFAGTGAAGGAFHVCHGELNQHHILVGRSYIAITEFNKMHLGIQIEDLYLFIRKVMEKHGWEKRLGTSMMEAYERVLPLDSLERQCLYFLFLYPEKYWKQINFYYNANKAWVPARNAEKIRNLKEQQAARMDFIAGIR